MNECRCCDVKMKYCKFGTISNMIRLTTQMKQEIDDALTVNSVTHNHAFTAISKLYIDSSILKVISFSNSKIFHNIISLPLQSRFKTQVDNEEWDAGKGQLQLNQVCFIIISITSKVDGNGCTK